MKLLIKLAVVLVVLVVVAGIGLFIAIDSIAKTAIEKGGTWALGVETSLDSADVGVTSGTFAMSGLAVANPEGYGAEHFMHLGSGDVSVDFGTLQEDIVELPTLNLDALQVSLEKKGGKANYNVILENLEKISGDEGGGDDGEEGKKFKINEVVVTDIKVHVDLLPVGGDLTALDLDIDEIKLNDVGSDGGVPLGKLTGIIVQAVFEAIVAKGGDLLPTDLLGDLTGALANLPSLSDLGIDTALGDITGALGEGAAGLAEGAGEAAEAIGDVVGEGAGDVGNAIGEGIGNLLGGDDDEDDG